jgi:hypothetical protein
MIEIDQIIIKFYYSIHLLNFSFVLIDHFNDKYQFIINHFKK